MKSPPTTQITPYIERQGGNVHADPVDFISNVQDMNGQVPMAADRDLASSLVKQHRLQLLSDSGRDELSVAYGGAAEKADSQANTKEDEVRETHIPIEGDPHKYQIPVNH